MRLQMFIHNLIIHPLMCVLPRDTAIRLHDWHGNIAFQETYNIDSIVNVLKETGNIRMTCISDNTLQKIAQYFDISVNKHTLYKDGRAISYYEINVE